jgi:hypothetical protein
MEAGFSCYEDLVRRPVGGVRPNIQGRRTKTLGTLDPRVAAPGPTEEFQGAVRRAGAVLARVTGEGVSTTVLSPIMGNTGSYRAEKHFKRFRYAFISFIHQLMTQPLRSLDRKQTL